MPSLTRIAFIGAGNMGRAIIKGIHEAKIYPPDEIVVCDAHKERERSIHKKFGVRIGLSAAEAASEAPVILLAIKPQNLDEAAAEIRPFLSHKPLIITILAGVSVARIHETLGEGLPVVRVMPNLPALVGAGISVLAAGPNVDVDLFEEAQSILATVGEVMELPENLLNAVTALSGSGPGFLFRLIEAFAEAGAAVGINRKEAVHLVTQTFYGAAKLLVETGEPAGELRVRVSSPGGTTLAGLDVMEKGGIDDLITEVIIRARDRAKELGEQAGVRKD